MEFSPPLAIEILAKSSQGGVDKNSQQNEYESILDVEERKLTTYRGACESISMDSEPLVFDSFGGMGPRSLKTMQRIIARVTEKSCSPAEDSAYYWRRLSLILARAVCRQLIIAMN